MSVHQLDTEGNIKSCAVQSARAACVILSPPSLLAAIRGLLHPRENDPPALQRPRAQEPVCPIQVGAQEGSEAGPRHQDGLDQTQEEARETEVLHALEGLRSGHKLTHMHMVHVQCVYMYMYMYMLEVGLWPC